MGPIETFLTADHARLDELLRRADRPDGTIDGEVYAEFREGLLRHIAMEEKILLPFAREKRGGSPLEIAPALRRDHGAIAKLLVPSPTHALCEELRTVLTAHNALEEGDGALYATCDALAGEDAPAVVDRLRGYGKVPVAPHYDGPLLRRPPR